jgi:hypothetical protein
MSQAPLHSSVGLNEISSTAEGSNQVENPDPEQTYKLQDFSQFFDVPEDTLRRVFTAFNLNPDATYIGPIEEVLPQYKTNIANFYPSLAIPYHDAVKFRTIGFLCGWQEAAQRMSNECTTFGLICSLLATLLYPVIVNPPSFQAADGRGLVPIGMNKVSD